MQVSRWDTWQLLIPSLTCDNRAGNRSLPGQEPMARRSRCAIRQISPHFSTSVKTEALDVWPDNRRPGFRSSLCLICGSLRTSCYLQRKSCGCRRDLLS
ncbi:hypothetical protein AAFF_G00162800 [Aldrovandia affinis]|uniref:Uncharacterized protein n=1 Tax=Aldrovandia affinis TaxID=143900 RepID=A0AAD7T0E0_9TELE|nr:hypothetical protein AAFF_G00162800 [Aldrovandia affinis]